MKKSLSFLIIPSMLISSCALTQRCSDLWNRLFHKGEQKEVVTVESVLKSFEKMEQLNSYTVEATVSASQSEGTKSVNSKKIPSVESGSIVVLTEQDGKNTRSVTSLVSEETVKIASLDSASRSVFL